VRHGPSEKAEMKQQDAEEFTQALGQIVAGSWRQIALAQRLGVPKALGLSVEQWVQDRLGGYIKLSVSERREAVQELKKEGHSNRDVAAIVGVDEATVRRHGAANDAAAPKKPSKSKAVSSDGAANAAARARPIERTPSAPAALPAPSEPPADAAQPEASGLKEEIKAFGSPADVCRIHVRRLVYQILEEMPKEQWLALFASLRRDMDELAKEMGVAQ
jgi:hypothetical protein